MLLKIAGRLVRVEGERECGLLNSMPGFPVFMVDEGSASAQWTVRFGRNVALPETEELYSFVSEDTGHRSVFSRKDGKYYYACYCLDGGDPFVMRYDGSAVIDATSVNDPSTLRFALWMAFACWGAGVGVAPVHSSVVVHQGQAVLFLGESGTGKSTHTRLWLQHIPDARLLNDDSPILAVEEGHVAVYGSPWSGKTHCYHPDRFPLAAAVRLSQAPENRIRRLGTIEAFMALQPSFPPGLSQDERFTDRLVSVLSRVISQVPVYHLECLPDGAAARTSHDAIFGTR